MGLTHALSAGRSRRDLIWQLDTPAGLALMFAAAFILRILIAPHFGFYGDLRLFKIWTGQLADVGTHHFYVKGQFQDYPPGYLYVLWLTSKISATPGYLLLKLPAIVADLALAWIAGTLAVRIAPESLRERWPVRALVAAGVLFNPAVIALGAGWGQVDAVPAAFILGSLLLLYTGPKTLQRELAAFLLFAVAIAMKPQSGFVFPVMLYALYRRYLHHRPRPLLIDGALSIAAVGAPAIVLWGISGLAFGLGPIALIHFYQHSASVYPVTSANAFNFWGSIAFWRNDSIGDNVLSIAGISALHFGELVLIAGAVYVIWRTHRAIERGASEPLALMVASATISLLAYTFLTRMHERYMFLALATFAPLVVVRQLRLAYAGLSALFLLNLWYPYAFFNSGWHVRDLHYQPWFGWILGGFTNDTWQKRVWSVGVTLIALAVTWFGIRWVERLTANPGTLPSAGRPAPLVTVERPPSATPVRTETRTASPVTRASRWAPLALVTLACVFGLIVLRHETTPVANLNDSAFHEQMVRWAHGQIDQGKVPLDGWFPDLSLGSSFFHHYQSLSETLTAYAAKATGATDDGTYLWIMYVLLALWPISVYLGGRLLEWDKWSAAAAAAVSPVLVSAPGYGYEHGSYTFQGYGVYSQLWAMWLLPLAWGFTWQAVARGRRYAAAALALALTIAVHFITGYLALLTVGVWVIVLWRGGFLRRVGRAALVSVGSLLIAAWVLVPLIGDTKYTTQSEFYKGTIFNDSFGARKILGWLFDGKLFDNGRFPIVTILFFVGAIVCGERFRRDPRARALLGAFTLSLFLFFGRVTWGRLIDLLPGFHDIQIHRFLVGVDLAGILIAGVGLGWLVRTAYSLALRRLPRNYSVALGGAAVALCVLLLAPAWIERAHYDERGADFIDVQKAADETAGRDLDRLIAMVKQRGDGRVYAGLRGNWGLQYVLGSVPVHAYFADRDVDAIGFTFRTIASLSTDTEASFDEANPADYQMFNVKYVILPPDRQPTVPATLLARSGNFRLFQVNTSGYTQVVDRASPVTADRADLRTSMLPFMQSKLAAQNVYPGVTFAGGTPSEPTFTGATPPPGTPGSVIAQTATPQDGLFGATVQARRPAVVLLKASYDPRWTATVDGQPAEPVMMAPSLVGVQVPVGTHNVRFRYKSYSHYTLLLAIGVLTLLGLVLVPRREAIRRRVTNRGTRSPKVTDGREGAAADPPG